MSMVKKLLRKLLVWVLDNQDNPFHPLVWINGNPQIGEGTYIGGFSEIYAKGADVIIGEHCDIASFVVINCADSHRKTIGCAKEVERLPIVIKDNVFIGTHSAILGGTTIGHHSVVGAGVVLKNIEIPPFSLVLRDNSGKLKIFKKYYLKNHIYITKT